MFGPEVFQQWIAGFNGMWNLFTIFYIITGTFLGIIIGAIPGFTSSMGAVILLPLTLYMSPINALTFLCAVYVSAIYGGALTAILLNTPGTPEATATTFDGYPMTLQGKSSEAIGLAIGASVIGGLISYAFLLLVMFPIGNFALRFGSSEMFLVALFGITIIASLSGKSFAKSLLAGIFGLLLGTIGISSAGEWRSTFGFLYLADGIPLIPPLIGLFAMSELFNLAERKFVTGTDKGEQSIRRILIGMRQVLQHPVTILRSALIGIFIGAIPGAGATIAVFTSYNEAKRYSKYPQKFGTGYPEGIVAAETANNASTGGAMMTTMALGIPGSSTCVVILAAFMIHGLRPGPTLLREQSVLVYGLIMAFIISQVFMVGMTILAGHFLSKLLVVPTYILVPVITMFCVVGSFAVRNTIFDVFLMFIFGVIGWIMRKNDYPPVATVLGIVLGPIADAELIRTSIRFGDKYYLAFINRPICIAIIILIIISVIRPYLQRWLSLHTREKEKNNSTE